MAKEPTPQFKTPQDGIAFYQKRLEEVLKKQEAASTDKSHSAVAKFEAEVARYAKLITDLEAQIDPVKEGLKEQSDEQLYSIWEDAMPRLPDTIAVRLYEMLKKRFNG